MAAPRGRLALAPRAPRQGSPQRPPGPRGLDALPPLWPSPSTRRASSSRPCRASGPSASCTTRCSG
eukprot:2533677-Lingulodinium_polyedra.AAC.1